MKDFKLSEGSSVFLDLIRGVSAQLVVVGHGISFFSVFVFLQHPYMPYMQNIAVLVFFLLSGFLITYSTLRKKKRMSNYSFKYFFFDRFSRIYTAFIPSLVFVLLIDLLSVYLDSNVYSYFDAYNIKTFVANVFMLQDYPVFNFLPNVVITSFGSARPFWTLAIEWWLYLFFGYITLVFINKKNIINIAILGFFSIVPLFNLFYAGGNGLTVYWLFGASIYFILNNNILLRVTKNIKILFIVILIILASLRVLSTMKEYELVFAFLLSLILLFSIDLAKNKKFSNKIKKIIKLNASYSYTLYLIHYSILDFTFSHFNGKVNSYLLFIIAFILSNIISFSIGYYTETVLTKRIKTYLYKY